MSAVVSDSSPLNYLAKGSHLRGAGSLGDRNQNAPVLMDERRGVRCARSRGLVVIRTPLIYADAKICS